MVEINLLENKDSLLRRIGKRLPTSADMLESPDEFLVLINVPGCDEEDIDLRFVKGNLKVEATRSEVHEDFIPVREGRPNHLSERVPIPEDVDAEGATAKYRNGVLRVRLPKIEESEPEPETEPVVEEEEYREVEVSEQGDEEETEAEEVEEDTEEEGEKDDDFPDTRDELEELSYRELQKIAKQVDVKGNLPKDEMRDGIADALDL